VSNLIIGYQNNVLTGTLTGSSNTSGLDVTQLQNDQGNPATAWQTTSAANATLTISGVTSGKWRVFGMHNTNLTQFAVVSVVVRNGGSGGTIVYSGTLSALTTGYRQVVGVAPAEVTGDWCQFSIIDPSNPDGYFNIPQVYAGTGFQPVRNMGYASATSRTASGVKSTLRAGGVIVRNDYTKRSYDCTFAGLKATELPTIRAIELAGEQGNNVLFVPNPASATITQEAVFGEWEPQTGLTYPYQNSDARGYRVVITERL
jgi:hypothetical protein